MPGNGCFIAIKMTSTIHQIPQPPPVINFRIPRPIWPIINLSTPSDPTRIDKTRVKTQFNFFVPPAAGAAGAAAGAGAAASAIRTPFANYLLHKYYSK
ncbi:hypothetical protein AUJ40_01530 [Candidatus Berkelbacteria bacterium CG1_02_42_45]|uniref:Uncharacterized protein n=1 Tax=Candidatus Berkelbacteria bacterium CG1_02_42_45 TaxID=1805036 RepID=A0A1J4RQL4_9BACT|nr:MAG: hypothetical protein AUJ40_01530 [Candidatus Berkelbacteria bacterium CG1_02_42_45]